jgi:hypothetical protein
MELPLFDLKSQPADARNRFGVRLHASCAENAQRIVGQPPPTLRIVYAHDRQREEASSNSSNEATIHVDRSLNRDQLPCLGESHRC